MNEIAEIVHSIEQLQNLLDELLVRGLRTVDPPTLARLRSIREEFERIGAAHLSQRLAQLIGAIEADNPAAARALLSAQTSLRLFERVLSLEVAAGCLESLVSCDEEQIAEEETPA